MLRYTPLYFDYNATTPVDSLVSSAMMPYITSMWGNPSSSHYYGKGPKQAVELARRQIAKAINAESFDTITFTSGGTESANWAITGTVSIFKKEYDENKTHLDSDSDEDSSEDDDIEFNEEQLSYMKNKTKDLHRLSRINGFMESFV